MNYYTEKQIEAAEKVKTLLSLPMPDAETPGPDDEEFDPWRLFPALYGSYSSAFDTLAIEVLEAIRDNTYPSQETLAYEMFREMCCTAHLCSYGTSPRTCFATPEFKVLLPELIEKWKKYYDVMWVGENIAHSDRNQGIRL